MISTIIQVAIGGALGASSRYLVGAMVAFPIGTLAVNIIGSFLIGVAFVVLAEKGLERWMPLVMTGFLGGFTTFSAFSLDAFKLYEAGRLGAAGGYVLTSVVASILALMAAILITRGLQG